MSKFIDLETKRGDAMNFQHRADAEKRHRQFLIRHLQDQGASRGQARAAVRAMAPDTVRRSLPLRLRLKAMLPGSAP